ncbi:carboxypeptidase-like regulatory domain-containing protein [Reichenbachiella ulvae]|uniref:Carboxypeptidase-like regulatory domain-containing protein n=1 Tax=Reichenbachiella ulvae TaxID=2980104 RepID=A0ABT3CX94_9BACT|nr:carboxypeptidase-like regulatory domain-containing protein [Reichenbachiella ulvae]MCV9388164.1 carboxypeptidase-like regulatory domain-containing protein [Reichenbachiella ulvae]
MPNFLCAFFLLISGSLYAQSQISAKVTNGNESIPYVNINLLHTNLRTVSNQNGHFSLSYTDENLADTLSISCVGFEPYRRPLSQFLKEMKEANELVLVQSTTQLPEFVFSDRPLKKKVLGSKNAGKMIQVGFSSVGPGDQIGTIFRVREDLTFINQLHIKPTYVNNDSLLFRLNFYDIKKGLPNTKHQVPLILFNSSELKAHEVFTLDLTEYGIVMTNDFYLSIECVENLDEDGQIVFAGSFSHGPIIGRLQEDAEWRKFPMFGMGIFLSVEY